LFALKVLDVSLMNGNLLFFFNARPIIAERFARYPKEEDSLLWVRGASGLNCKAYDLVRNCLGVAMLCGY
jgi:hypothetical protein